MIGQTLSHYRIIEKLGQGGMGEVYLAEDSRLDRKVALKILPEHLSDRAELRERFEREARAVSSLNHPHICTLHDIGEQDGIHYLVMEHLEGETLAARLEKGPLPLEQTLEYAIQIADALEAAHKQNIVHRDLKPSNIMLTSDGHVKVMDFGLAKRVTPVEGQQEEIKTALTKDQSILGTVPYMSPEQVRGQEVDTRSDIFSFGIVLYEMLTGVNPFQGDTSVEIAHSIFSEAPPPLTRYIDDIPVLLQKTVRKMLEKDPNQRCQSVHEVGTGIGQLLAEASHSSTFGFTNLLQEMRKPQIAVPGILIVFLFSSIAVWLLNRNANVRWAKEQAIPEIVELIDEGRFWQAFTLAQEAEQYIPTDGSLVSLWPRISRNVSVNTTPPGADVYAKEYIGNDSDWKLLGSSPMDGIQVPLGLSRLRIEKAGYETVQGALNSRAQREVEIHLDEEGSLPPGMVRVVAGDSPVGMLDDFLVDKYEVTNKQFKEFIDNGGYQKKEYWKHEFVKDGRVLKWEEAMAEFRDSTGRPGPSTWEAEDYPDGQDDYPVNGLSWYEAAAYAEFVGKSLPTVFHWDRATGARVFQMSSSPILRLSNFGDDGPAAVGSHRGLNQYGTYDMAGNVREWCWNESRMGRFIRGGAWNDAHHLFLIGSQQSPFNRSFKNGFRCVRYLDPDGIPETAFQPVEYREPRDYSREKPGSDDIFQVYKNQFSYDPIELNPEIEWADKSAEDWTTEKITFDAAYENERMIAYLFLPKEETPPYQTVMVFPGTASVGRTSLPVVEAFGFVDFIVKSGRAVMYPVYKGTHERSVTDFPGDRTTHRYTEYVIKWVQDLKRSIEYLETRPEINIDQLAYFGTSWGGLLGAIIPAVEARLKVSILFLGGLPGNNLALSNLLFIGQARAEVDSINFVTRVTIPTLMLNGKYDNVFPLEANTMPMYDLLGTPKEHKRILLYETDHFIPRKEGIKESLAWLDRYLGPVR